MVENLIFNSDPDLRKGLILWIKCSSCLLSSPLELMVRRTCDVVLGTLSDAGIHLWLIYMLSSKTQHWQHACGYAAGYIPLSSSFEGLT